MKFIVLILFFVLGYCECWGEIGHRTTAAIAEHYLTKNAVRGVKQILDEYRGLEGLAIGKTKFDSLVQLSTYADDVRPSLPWTSAYHFINMAGDEIKYDEARQCSAPRYCIVKSLQNYTMVLRDPSVTNISRLGESLFFIVHFMGDIFQPLHAGNAEDLGGNRIPMQFSNDWIIDEMSSDVHWCWDHLILLHWMNLEGLSEKDVYAEFLKFIESDTNFRDMYLKKRKADTVTIIEDSRAVVVKLYRDLKKYNLSNVPIEYFVESWPVFKTQLMKSGLQMASLLNDIFDERSNHGDSLSSSSSTIFITIVISCFYINNQILNANNFYSIILKENKAAKR